MRFGQQSGLVPVQGDLLKPPLQPAVHVAAPAFSLLKHVKQVAGASATLRPQGIEPPEAPLKAPGKA